MSETEDSSRLEALSVENQLLQQQLAQAKEELKLEVENSKLKERLARQQLRNKVSKRNILGQIISRSPKPIARIILWLAYLAPFFFIFNTIHLFALGAGKNNAYSILLKILKAAHAGSIDSGNILTEALATRAKDFEAFSGFMLLVAIWLSYTTLRWYYNGAPRANSPLARLAQNPVVPLFTYSACYLSFSLGKSTQAFYTALQSIDNGNISAMLKALAIPEDINGYLSLTSLYILRAAFWTLFAVCLNREVQRSASPQGAVIQQNDQEP